MSDEFQITPPTIQAAGTDVPPEQIQAGFNSVCRQTQLALNILSTQPVPPSGPAGGDLGGTYPNPTVVALHVTSGTESGVAITASTLDSTPVGSTTPATGAFTTLTASTPVGIASGGTGSGTAAGARTNLGLGTIATQNANNVAITGGTIDNTPIGQTTPAAVSATTLNSTGGALNGTVGATTPNTGSFTTVTASTAITVPNGGTGRATLTTHGVLLGEGTAAINQTAAGTTGQMLLGVTGADPAFGNNPTITGGTVDGAVIGGTTPAAGHFTTVSATGAITPSSTNGIVGTTTNDNANAGSVGEFVTQTASAVSLTPNTPANVTSISLTAGDWDVTGNIQFNAAAGTTIASALASAGTTSATINNSPDRSVIESTQALANPVSLIAPVQRISITATTTVFLVGNCNFSGGTSSADGRIRARRIR